MNKALQKKIVKIIRESPQSRKIGKIYLFGSHARGDEKPDSDVDLIIEMKKPMGFEFFGLAASLEEKLKRKVDLLTTESINYRLKPYINKDKILIDG
ncbi:nucleotidyltransferase domain-containing protein [Patescibacteria group bacterium]|nr:nucleotidyltransferase domain-containing protein [Patescibacteria group bacterium]